MPTNADPLNVVVLLGGPSAERDVSLDSGRCVAAGLREQGCRVIEFDPAAGAPAEEAERFRFARRQTMDFDWRGIDVAFNALHGTFGEDGEVQALLDELGVPYTGSGAAASRVGFNKTLAKQRFHAHKVASPRGLTVPLNGPPQQLEAAAATLGWPLVVKPPAQGSSLGVSIVPSRDDLPAAVARCLTFGPNALLEEYIPGTEWTAAVWDDFVLPLIQVVPAVEFYDYSAKYADDRTQYRFDSELPADVLRRMEDLAREAARAVRAAGLARVDIRLDPQHRPWVLEVNTSPGMTSHSLTPKSAARLGLSLGRLCEQECRRGIRRCGRVSGTRRRAA